MDFTLLLSVVFLAVAAGAFVKGVTGVGLPVIATPVMAAALNVDHAVAIMVIPAFVSNAFMVWNLRREARANRELWILIVAGVPGIGLGAWALAKADPKVMFLVLAAWVFLYLALRYFRPNARISDEGSRTMSPAAGFVSGLFQTGVGLSFPVFAAYLQARGFERARFAYNAAMILVIFNGIHFFVFSGFGLMTARRAMEGGMALVPMAVGLWLGIKLAPRLEKRFFDWLVSAILFASAVTMAYRGLAPILMS